MKLATLIIGGWSSTCSACGGNADPGETSHVHGGPGHMYAAGSALSDTNGCGARYTDVEAEFDSPLYRAARSRILGEVLA